VQNYTILPGTLIPPALHGFVLVSRCPSGCSLIALSVHENSRSFSALPSNLIAVSRLEASALPAQVSPPIFAEQNRLTLPPESTSVFRGYEFFL
jgi:hypothetical protein